MVGAGDLIHGPDPESAVRAWWVEIAPGVWSAPLLRASAIAALRAELERAANAGIPKRRPNGMNRYEMILDGEVDWAVHFLGKYVEGLVRQYLQVNEARSHLQPFEGVMIRNATPNHATPRLCAADRTNALPGKRGKG